MNERCTACRLQFEREPGYFIGAIYVNYAMSAVLVVCGYFALQWWLPIPLVQQLLLWGAASLLLPLILFRHARSLWMSLDYLFNPVRDDASETLES